MIAFEALRFKKGSGCAFKPFLRNWRNKGTRSSGLLCKPWNSPFSSDEQSPSCGFHSGNASFPEPFRGIELGFVRLGFK